MFFGATNKAKAGQRAAWGVARRREIRQDGWRRKDGWLSSKPMAEWHGVTANAEGRVIGLDLGGNDLAGKRRYDMISYRRSWPNSLHEVPVKLINATLDHTKFLSLIHI